MTQAFKEEYYTDQPHLEPVYTSKETPRLPRKSFLGISRTKDKSITLEYALEIMVQKTGRLMGMKQLQDAENTADFNDDNKDDLMRMRKKKWFCSLKDDFTWEIFQDFRKNHYDAGHILNAGADATLEQVREGVLALKAFFKPEELHANEIQLFDRAILIIDKHIVLGKQAVPISKNTEDAVVQTAGLGLEGKINRSPMTKKRL